MTNQELRIWAIEQAMKLGDSTKTTLDVARELMQFVNSTVGEKINPNELQFTYGCSHTVRESNTSQKIKLQICNAHGKKYAVPSDKVDMFYRISAPIDFDSITRFENIFKPYFVSNRLFYEAD